MEARENEVCRATVKDWSNSPTFIFYFFGSWYEHDVWEITDETFILTNFLSGTLETQQHIYKINLASENYRKSVFLCVKF